MDTSTLSKQGLMDIAKSLRLRNYSRKNKTDIKKMIDSYYQLHGEKDTIPKQKNITIQKYTEDIEEDSEHSDTDDEFSPIKKEKKNCKKRKICT